MSELVATLLRFGRERIRAGEIDKEGRIPAPLLEALAELGAFGLSIPEAYGGSGLSLAEVCSAVAALARIDRSVATTVGLHLGLGTRGLVAFGTAAQRDQYLPALASGRTIAAFAATEAGAGSDLAAIRTTAAEIAPGRLRVDGAKLYVTNGGLAQLFTVAVASPGLGGMRRGHSLLLLERGDPGLTTHGEERKLGLRGSSTTGLQLEGVEVRWRASSASPAAAWSSSTTCSPGAAPRCRRAAPARRASAIEKAAEHTANRRQFGRPLAAFEVVREQLAHMAALAFAMEALVARTCEAQPAALAARSRAAKVFCSEGDWEICDLAVQLHGGSGFLEDTGLPLLLRDARITRIFEGANDVLLVAHGAAEATAPGARAMVGLQAADELAVRIAQRRDELRVKFGVRLLAQQRLLHRLGRALVLSEAADASALRATAEGTPASAALAAHFAECARERALPLLADPPPLDRVDAIAKGLAP